MKKYNIAITSHIYYGDMIESITNKLALLKIGFDLFISTADEAIARRLEIIVNSIPNVNTCEICISPNIGRNFAPLLVEFSDRLSEYEIMCHIHTKKSLHTDYFSGWGDYLLENTIGSDELVTQIIELFDSDVHCGLIYPKKFSQVPSWALDWLNNQEIALKLCEKFNEPLRHFKLDFPSGGMFWARPHAIRQILSYDWCYSEFPQEAGQIDGTTHHAIERLVGAIASLNCYSHYIYDPVKCSFFRLC